MAAANKIPQWEELESHLRKEWVNHPITQAFKNHLKQARLGLQENLGSGLLTKPEAWGTLQLYNDHVGRIAMCSDVIEIMEFFEQLGKEEQENAGNTP